MTSPTLIVLAAGIGSRYGGLKQVDPVGPGGEIIIDYSIYDALRAGFEKIVFVIKKDNEKTFRQQVGKNVEPHCDVDYVFQELDNLPLGFDLPSQRVKPWGTAHAALSCKDVVDTPFAVINADDFYGASAFELLSHHLRQAKDQGGIHQYCMVGYTLENTITEHGYVARGVCQTDAAGYLVDVDERTRIEKFGSQVKYSEDNGETWIEILGDSIVSMNCWGFTVGFFDELETQFPRFLQDNAANIEKAEYFLPYVVKQLIQQNKARVKVLSTDAHWFGVTYQEDKPRVKKAVFELVRRGIYPQNLWGA
jgi:NDP-sugar pyrophosphorylase family protein